MMDAQPSARFTVLASGSSGNASLLEVDGFGLLIDCGLRPAVITERLSEAGRTWRNVDAVLITHTHSDHWNRYTLAHLRSLKVPLIGHPRHHSDMSRSREHEPLRRANLVREFVADQSFTIAPGLTAVAVEVPHDSSPTFAFRFESRDPVTRLGWSLGFASDVGHPTEPLLNAFLGVDALAIEYNHDVGMQRRSRRPRILIDRVLGSYGHLSNRQAADVTTAIAQSGSLTALIQLHLSRECNLPEVAREAGQAAIRRDAPTAKVVTTSQFRAAEPVTLPIRAPSPPRPAVLPIRPRVQPCLPGLDADVPA